MEVGREPQKRFLTICCLFDSEELVLVLLALLHMISISSVSWKQKPDQHFNILYRTMQCHDH
jgi:hypothetical protein